MRTLKVMSIIGIIVFVLGLIVFVTPDVQTTDSLSGWGIITGLYGLSVMIVGLVHSVRILKKHKE